MSFSCEMVVIPRLVSSAISAGDRHPPKALLARPSTWSTVRPAAGPDVSVKLPRPAGNTGPEKSTFSSSARTWPAKTPAAEVVGLMEFPAARVPGVPPCGKKSWIALASVNVKEPPGAAQPTVTPAAPKTEVKLALRIAPGLFPCGGAPQPPCVTVVNGPGGA